MRPISLEMEGFTSFRQKAVIDFSKFDLFAITGPTGAGKTSIIDAMIYALYGCTPRISNKSIKELISQGSDRLKVLLEFSSGQSCYRIARETKWTGKSSITSIRLEQKDGEKWVALADKIGQADPLVENIVGLDFSGFTKSVVLPQGRFDEFLKGKIDERRKILSDLLLLDVYSRMMQRANEIAKENKNKSDTLADLLTRDYSNATPENLTRFKKELELLKPSLEPLTAELSRIRESVPVAHQLRQARNDLANAEAELKQLGPDRASAERNLNRAQQVIKTSQDKIKQIEDRIRATIYDSAVRDDLVAKLHKSESLQELEKRARELIETQKKKSQRLERLESDYKKASAAHQAASDARAAHQRQFNAEQKTLNATLQKHGSPDAIKAAIETNKRRLKEEKKKEKLEKELDGLTEDQKASVKKVAQLDDELLQAQALLNQTKADLEDLVQEHSAEVLKRLLEEGKPCPVCEQAVKLVPKSRAHPSVELAKKSVTKCEAELRHLETTKSKIQGQLEQLMPRLKSKGEECEEVDAAIAEASTQIRALLKKIPGPDTEAELEGLRKEVVALHDKVDKLAKKLNEWREAESTAKQKAEEIKGDLIRVRSEVSSDTDALRRVQTEIQALRTSLGKHADVAIVRAELKKQNEAKQELDANTHLKETESEAFSKAKDVLAESTRILEGLKVKGDELERTRTRLNKNIEQHRDLLSSAFPKLKIEAVGLERDPAAQLEHQSQALQTQREVVQKKILQQEEEIKTLSVQIKRAADMRKEIDHHRSAAAVAHDLAQALRGDQFIAFIQQEAYHRLALDGSRHLKTLSSDRFSFDFDKDEFVVLDHWNADEPRPVTTLSGGESFLASLALALALAEGLSGLSHGRGRFALESLFLDEGFGTLDVETLDVVLQGVENLSTTDRLVGIVSHIPDLAERMPSRIHVRKAVGGSTVDVSY
jgi:DNA repair protein SbcC/Rad50